MPRLRIGGVIPPPSPTIAQSPGQDLWNWSWTKWHWVRCSTTSVSLANSHSTDCSTFIIYHPGLVQYVKQWPTCQVDSVSPHPNKLKKLYPYFSYFLRAFCLIKIYVGTTFTFTLHHCSCKQPYEKKSHLNFPKEYEFPNYVENRNCDVPGFM
jgi:hypothetical protein